MSSHSWPLMVNNVQREDLDSLIEHLKQEDPKLTHGPKVREFEEKWSEWLGVKHSVMLNSGASANDLSMLALREIYGTGEVIVPALTWVSDIASVLHAGHTPVFVDIDPNSLGMSTDKILEAITPRTKAVFYTYVLGYNGLTDKLLSELNKQGILLIEDVCESHGATHNGKKLGSFGWASNFSFYYAHHMTTIEGGMISTNDENLFDLARMLRSHGMVRESWKNETKTTYIMNYPDLNSDFIFAHYAHNMRPTELNGILGLSQLTRLDANNQKRNENLKYFLSKLDTSKYRTNFRIEGSSNYAFTIILKERDWDLREKVEKVMKTNAIEFRRGLSGGGNQLRQPYLKKIGRFPDPETLIETEHVHNFAWYVGNYPTLEKSKIDWLCELLKNV